MKPRSKRADNARKPKAEVASALLTVRVTRADLAAWKAAAAMVGCPLSHLVKTMMNAGLRRLNKDKV